MEDKSHDKFLIKIIEATMSLTCKDFGFDELRTGQFRGQFVKNMTKVMGIMLSLEMEERYQDKSDNM